MDSAKVKDTREAVDVLRELLADADAMARAVPKPIELMALDRLRSGIKSAKRWLKERGHG